jgi:hypothetical protein
VVAAGLVPLEEVALIHDDPPYGVGEKTDRKRRGRDKVSGAGLHGGNYSCRDFPLVVGDDKPHDPLAVLSLERPTVLWGANHYASRLPDSPSWILWDKRDRTGPDDNADGELAWTNLDGPLRIFRHLWRGLCRASETGSGHLSPTQKPIALCVWVYQRAKLKRGDLVFVPHMGSGPDLAACRAMGLRCIACDVESWCCKTAVGARLCAAPHPETGEVLGPLFAQAGSSPR